MHFKVFSQKIKEGFCQLTEQSLSLLKKLSPSVDECYCYTFLGVLLQVSDKLLCRFYMGVVHCSFPRARCGDQSAMQPSLLTFSPLYKYTLVQSIPFIFQSVIGRILERCQNMELYKKTSGRQSMNFRRKLFVYWIA